MPEPQRHTPQVLYIWTGGAEFRLQFESMQMLIDFTSKVDRQISMPQPVKRLGGSGEGRRVVIVRPSAVDVYALA